MAGFANSSFEILAGIGVFAAVGFMAAASSIGVADAATQGPGLAFVAFPTIISNLPTTPELFGVLFFGSLVIAGLSSLISIVEVVVATVQDRWGMRRERAVLLIGGAAALVSLALFPTREGLYILDVADHFINQYVVALAALVVVLGAVTPIVLGWMMYDSLRREFADNYEGYTTGFLLLAGWGVAIAAIVFGLAMSLLRWRAVEAEPAFGVVEGSRDFH